MYGRVNEEKVKNYDIVNNNSKFVHYNDNVYYIANNYIGNKMQYKICSLPIEFDETNNDYKEIFSSDSTLETGLYIYDNKIFYKYLTNTYMYNLLDENTSMFCEGTLQYIKDNKFITLYEGSLYEGEYYPVNYVIKSYRQLSQTKFKKMFENNDSIFYLNTDNTESKTLYRFNKDTKELKIYDKIDLTLNNDVLDVSYNDGFIYELIDGYSGLFIKRINEKSNNNMDRINLYEFTNVNFINDNNSKKNGDLCFYGTKSGDNEGSYYIVKSNSDKEEIYSNFSYLNYYDFSVKLNKDENKVCLYKNNELITEVSYEDENITSAELEYIEIVENYIYYKINLISVQENIENYNDTNLSEDTNELNIINESNNANGSSDTDLSSDANISNDTTESDINNDIDDIDDIEDNSYTITTKIPIIARTEVKGGESFIMNNFNK